MPDVGTVHQHFMADPCMLHCIEPDQVKLFIMHIHHHQLLLQSAATYSTVSAVVKHALVQGKGHAVHGSLPVASTPGLC